MFGISLAATPMLDAIEFLWGSLGLFGDGTADPDTVGMDRPLQLDLHAVAEAQDRIRQRLAATPDGAALDQLPAPPDTSEDEERRVLRLRSAWVSPFSASLELAKQGEVGLGQGRAFTPIQIARLQVANG